jgi:malate synthase
MPRIADYAHAGYPDVYTPEAVAALEALAPLDERRRELTAQRIALRAERARDRRPIEFLPGSAVIDGTSITVADARAGRFAGAVIPADLRRQWIQGTGPATKPRSSTASGLRNVAYAMLSGADGWMFDGEDALGQIETMSLDNQRNLKLMIDDSQQFRLVTSQVAKEINDWAKRFFGRATAPDWQEQIRFTTRIFRARGLHLDDRHIAHADGRGFSASIADLSLSRVA